ncbi:hypothetical protein FKM82_004339, partial [Ascaphus truei]
VPTNQHPSPRCGSAKMAPVRLPASRGLGAGHAAGTGLLLLAGEEMRLVKAGGPGELGDSPQQVRIHPGIIAAVVVVALLALLAAVFIVKKYCFPERNITYRYSVLRRHQDDLDNSTTNRLQDDSDEDLLE